MHGKYQIHILKAGSTAICPCLAYLHFAENFIMHTKHFVLKVFGGSFSLTITSLLSSPIESAGLHDPSNNSSGFKFKLQKSQPHPEIAAD